MQIDRLLSQDYIALRLEKSFKTFHEENTRGQSSNGERFIPRTIFLARNRNLFTFDIYVDLSVGLSVLKLITIVPQLSKCLKFEAVSGGY